MSGPAQRPAAPRLRPGSVQAVPEAEPVPEEVRRAMLRRLPPDQYRPLSGSRRALLAMAGVAMALTVAWLIFERPGHEDYDARLLQADQPRCAPGQTQGCVGGRAEVIAPVQRPSPRPSPEAAAQQAPQQPPTAAPAAQPAPAVMPVYSVAPASVPGR
jgi:hypothetical protein